jgi:hypothetical protein
VGRGEVLDLLVASLLEELFEVVLSYGSRAEAVHVSVGLDLGGVEE